jgi:hypothetical protein
VDHGIGARSRASERGEIRQVARYCLVPERLDGRSLVGASHESGDVTPAGLKCFAYARTDVSRRARDQNPHAEASTSIRR